MQPIKLLSVTALASLIGVSTAFAGSNAAQDWNVAEISALPQNGSNFQQNLHRDYVTLAKSELTEESDTYAMANYNYKARKAATGNAVAPTAMSEKRALPTAHVKELTDARANLMRMLDAGGPSKAPTQASRAQTQFDCWIEEQTENRQPEKIALCRDGFHNALEQASAAVKGSMPAPMAAMPSTTATPAIHTYTVYFDHNSLKLNNASMATNKEVSDFVKASGAKTVLVSGYTDTSGNNEYNRKLAQARAMAVSDAIELSGIKPIIDTESFGENRLAVETKNGVQNWENRRVVIRVQ